MPNKQIITVPSSVLSYANAWEWSALSDKEVQQEALLSPIKKRVYEKSNKDTHKSTSSNSVGDNPSKEVIRALEELFPGINEKTLGRKEMYQELRSLLISEWSTLSDKLSSKRLKALHDLHHQRRVADKLDHHWKYLILNQKLIQLMQTSSPEEVDAVLLEPKVYKGIVKVPATCTLQEEALFWMDCSLDAPLSAECSERYFMIARKLFPEINL